MKKIITLGLLILAFGMLLISPALAQTEGCPPGETCFTNPLSVNTPQELIGNIINSVLGVVGSIALLMFVFGGITWMTSSGNQEKIKKGRDIIVWAAIGLAIVFFSYGVVKVLIVGLQK